MNAGRVAKKRGQLMLSRSSLLRHLRAARATAPTLRPPLLRREEAGAEVIPVVVERAVPGRFLPVIFLFRRIFTIQHPHRRFPLPESIILNGFYYTLEVGIPKTLRISA